MIRPLEERRVVVTGLGVMTSIGRNVDSFWQALVGRGDAPCKAGNANEAGDSIGDATGAIRDFQGRIDEFGELPDAVRKSLRKALKMMNRETLLGVAAGQQALADSGVQRHHEPDRIGVCFGAQQVSVMPQDFREGIEVCCGDDRQFDFDRWGTEGIPKIEPLWILKCLPNMPACYLAMVNDIRGHCNTITQRDVAANQAVAEGYHVIQDGEAEAILVGASGTTLHPFNLVHARLEDELATPQDGASAVCRPFDLHRIGPPPGEGAAALMLEEMTCAIRRGATIYGEIRGVAAASRARGDRTANCRAALADALRLALQRARFARGDVGHLHAHGLGTPASDIAEAAAIRDVFGDHPRRQPKIVAAKSHLGNVGSGGGAIELVASLLALRHGRLFPVLHYEHPDPACPVTPVTTLDEEAGASFVNLNMTVRGQASCVAVRVVD